MLVPGNKTWQEFEPGNAQDFFKTKKGVYVYINTSNTVFLCNTATVADCIRNKDSQAAQLTPMLPQKKGDHGNGYADVDIRNAIDFGLRTFVVDNPDEVRKFERLADRVELLLRVSFRSPGAMCDLSRKFGCDPEDALAIARLAAELGITMRGMWARRRRTRPNTSRPSWRARS